jgi:hypothetical protein
MAACTQGDEVFFRIISELASLLDVMNLKFRPTTTVLASPAVALQHLLT